MSQRVYNVGDLLELITLRFANLSAEPLFTRVRLQVVPQLPPPSPYDIFDVGADGKFGFPAGFDNDFGPLTLFNLPADIPPGIYSMRCTLEDPASGIIQAKGFFPMEWE